ncbi:MAG: ferredoxin/flavodoxin---NADP+ reductase [Chloroflexia bacterium]|jgi:thioredoxin reductase (NADPH)|nr:ferredoxin/flavodoxin---NADP+ reductase [Chloroflexia bacterium]
MESTERSGNGAKAPEGLSDPQETGGTGDGTSAADLYDVTIIGAGPTGLFAAFYAGMRTMKTKIIDALEEPGGQLMALYPEKYIYDAPGFPKIVAKDLVKNLVEQAMQWNPATVLGERVLRLEQAPEGHWVLTTDKGIHLSKAIVVSAGVGAFAPNKLNAPGVTDLEGQAVYYFVKEKSAFQGKDLLIVGGGDSAVDWALNLQDVAKSITVIHRRNEFRAHESSVTEMMNSKATVLTPYEVKEVAGDGKLERVTIYNNKTNEEQTLDVDAILVNIGFKADIGPIREWGLQLDKRGIVVNFRMETNLPGIFAAGDIAAEEVKMNLIATGYGQAAMAVNVAKNYIDPKASIFPGHSSEKM